MRFPNEFNYYVERGIVKTTSSDKTRAEFLKKQSEKSIRALKERIKLIGITPLQSDSIIKDSYDAIMELIRSRMLLHGLSAVGKGAHEAEVAYLQNLKFPENDIIFLNQLRYFRNGIAYYGKTFNKDYAEKVVSFLKKIIPKLNKIENNK
jgi:hypothetical protein